MKKPELRIIMLVYNTDRYIFQAIQSILNQTLKVFDLIINNDGSTDKTKAVIESFDDDSCIKFLK